MRTALDRLSGRHLCHATNPSASQSNVLVAVTPAVNGSLDQSTLATQRHIQLSESPSYTVTVRFVHKAVTSVLFLWTACARINTVFLLEFGRKLVRVDRLDIAANGVFHLDSVTRVFKSDPLHAVTVLSHN